MIPTLIQAHLRHRHRGYEHRVHEPAMTAQELAAAEHVSGHRVAKSVVVKLDGHLAIAVVGATERVNLAALEEATGTFAELAPEGEFARRFEPCEAGAEPPFAIFGVPIFADERLEHEQTLVMHGGTHQDAVRLDTHQWMTCEHVQPVANLGLRAH
jgi:Ala-tRNA(Pro) deacylase